MINVQTYLIKAMKKEIFNSSDDENKLARQILGELKTKQKDILTEITNDIQYKLLKKMKAEREDSAQTYINAARTDLAEKENEEARIIKELMAILEADMPKQLSEDEIRTIIQGIENPSMKTIMTAFKDKNVDKGLVAKIAKCYI